MIALRDQIVSAQHACRWAYARIAWHREQWVPGDSLTTLNRMQRIHAETSANARELLFALIEKGQPR